MKIFFINPPFKSAYGKFSRESRSPAVTKSGALYYPLWLIYAAAYAEKQGFLVKFLDAPAEQMNEATSLEYVKAHGKDTRLFVLDTSTPSIYSDIRFGEKLKDIYPDAFVLLVGTHPSATPEETLAYNTKIDGVARREYDITVSKLAKVLEEGGDLSTVQGLSYRKKLENKKSNKDAASSVICHNPDQPYLEDLDEIPMAAAFIKEHLNYKNYFFAAAEYPEIQIFTGRGCPCMCNFCVYPQTMHGHKYRLRTPENVVAEFRYIREHFPDVKEVVIEDDTFTISKERVKAICDLLIKEGLNKRFKWLCNARVNTLDLATMQLMKKAGCRLIIPGIESGNQKILDNIKKGTNLQQIHAYIQNAKRAGLLVHACYMVGNEGETKETMEETLRLALKLNTDTAQFFPLIPYPGTEAYAWAKKNHYLAGGYDDYCKEDGTHNCVLNLPGLSGKEMVDFCDEARRRYYLRPRYILHRLYVGLKDPADLKRSLKAFSKIKKYLFKK